MRLLLLDPLPGMHVDPLIGAEVRILLLISYDLLFVIIIDTMTDEFSPSVIIFGKFQRVTPADVHPLDVDVLSSADPMVNS